MNRLDAIQLYSDSPVSHSPSSAWLADDADVLGAGEPDAPLRAVLDHLGVSTIDFEAARDAARLHGSSADEELVAAGLVDEAALARAIAAAIGVPVEPIAPDATLLRDGRGAHQAGARHAKTCDASLRARLHIAPPLDRLSDIEARLASNPELRAALRITSASDIAAVRARATREERSNRARLSLAADFNRWSARDVLTPVQSAILVLAAVVLGHAWYLNAGWFWFAIHAGCSLVALGFTLFRLFVLLGTKRWHAPGRPVLPALPAPAAAMPFYTVLVALHREAAMAEPLARAMAALDWPRSRLEVFFVCEASDPETIAAVERAIAHEPNFSVIATPRTDPTTKPKALNFALPLARGEFIVLYDAEDRPDPMQLRQAYSAFRAGPASLACLQAPLTIRNAASGWLETFFALEYAVLFRAILPWLAARSLPLPLGGTSNHFRRAALVESGGWDSHNVAEDADLGIRLARLGFAVGTIDCPTSEIAPGRFVDWRNQRTRWIKGWLQTWLVHMRKPATTWRQLGAARFVMFQVLFGGMIAASLMHVVFAFHLGNAVFAYAVRGEAYLSAGILAAIDVFNIALAYCVFGLTARQVTTREERPLLRRLWSLWFYWLIVSYAGLRAAVQLARQPHMWEKTPHREPQPPARSPTEAG